MLKKVTGRDRDREHSHGISLDGNGVFRGIFTTGMMPGNALDININTGGDFALHSNTCVIASFIFGPLFFWVYQCTGEEQQTGKSHKITKQNVYSYKYTEVPYARY